MTKKKQGLPQVIRCVTKGRTFRAINKTKASTIEDRLIAMIDRKYFNKKES